MYRKLLFYNVSKLYFYCKYEELKNYDLTFLFQKFLNDTYIKFLSLFLTYFLFVCDIYLFIISKKICLTKMSLNFDK